MPDEDEFRLLAQQLRLFFFRAQINDRLSVLCVDYSGLFVEKIGDFCGVCDESLGCKLDF